MIQVLTREERSRRNLDFLNPYPGLVTPEKLTAIKRSVKSLNRTTQRNGRQYYSRLGYNTGVTSYTDGNEIGRFSGSSFNRLFAKQRRDELQSLLKKPAQITEEVGETVADHAEYEREINYLRSTLASVPRDPRRNSKSHDRSASTIHVLSPRSKGKVKDKCIAFHRSCGDKKTFCTLTFINTVDDRTGIAILNKFLTALRDEFSKFKYIWIAERQPTSGNIHFHAIFNVYLPVERYNALWTLQQYNAGLSYGDISIEEIRERIKSETLQEILNPFDIEKVNGIYGLNYYLTKYVTKNKSEGFNCLAWHCSRSISRLFTRTIVSPSCMRAMASTKNSRVDWKTGEIKEAKSITGKFYQLFYIENRPYFLREMAEVEIINRWILDGFRPDKIPDIDDIDLFLFTNYSQN